MRRVVYVLEIILLAAGMLLTVYAFIDAGFLAPDPDTSGYIDESLGRTWDLLKYTLLALAIVMALEICTAHWRRISVFVAFYHENETIALEIRDELHSKGFRVIFFEFRPRDHEDTISEVVQAIKRSDVILALPGPKNSWMDHELSMAEGLQKGIVLVEQSDRLRGFDYLHEGYPVFLLDRLRQDSFERLARFLRYGTRSLGSVVRLIVWSLVFPLGCAFVLMLATGLMFLVSLIILAIYFLILLFTDILDDHASFINYTYFLSFVYRVAVALPVISMVFISTQRRVQMTLNQQLVTRQFTIEALLESSDGVLLNEDIIRAMKGGDAALAMRDEVRGTEGEGSERLSG